MVTNQISSFNEDAENNKYNIAGFIILNERESDEEFYIPSSKIAVIKEVCDPLTSHFLFTNIVCDRQIFRVKQTANEIFAQLANLS